MLKIRRLPRPSIRRCWPLAALVLLHLSGTASAQPMADPGDKTKAIQIKLETVDGEPGRWARLEARIPEKGRRYYVRGLDVMAPLSIQVAAERTDRPVAVSLHRHAWGQTAASGSTGDSGLYRFDGRAHAQVGIRLTPTDGAAKVTLLVWQGDPVRADYASVIVPPVQDGNSADATAGAGAGDARAPAWTTYATLAVLVAIAGLLAALLLRRGRGQAASLLFASGLAMAMLFAVPAAPVQAADPPKDKNDESSDPKRELPAEKPDASPEKPKPGDKPELSADGDKDKKPPGDAASSDADKDKDAATGDYADRIASMEQHVRDLHEQAARDRAEVARLRLLVEEDRDSEPDPDNLPPMPLSCRPPLPGVSGDVIGANDHRWDDYEACQSCYAEPLAELEKQLELYERLRILYSSAKSDLSKMMAAGDMAPKPHYMVDSAWQAQKQKINVAFQQTQKAYDDKHLEFRDKLAGIVDAIGVCESRHNNNPMWRETTGRLFLETVSSSYRRND